MKKIILSSLLLSSIICGSNNIDELEQTIKNSNFKALKTVLTKSNMDKNECARMADLSQQITSQRNKTLISPSFAKAVSLSTLTLIASFIAIPKKGTYNSKIKDAVIITGLFGSISGLILSSLGIIVTQAKAGADELYNAYNARKIRNLLQQTPNENNEIVA